jgi:NitT/TauT family transport system substrate-binding protein
MPKFVDGASGGESPNKLISGEVEIAYASYTPFFLAESRNAAQGSDGIKIVADASSAGPNSCVVVALPSSPVKSVRDRGLAHGR